MYLKSNNKPKEDIDKSRTVSLFCLSFLSLSLFIIVCAQSYYIYSNGDYKFFSLSENHPEAEESTSSSTSSSSDSNIDSLASTITTSTSLIESTTTTSGNTGCDTDPELFLSYSTDAYDSVLEGNLFAYISMSSGMYTVPNSVLIYDDNANVLSCINAIDFVHQANIPMEKSYTHVVEGNYNSSYGVPSFWAVKKINEDTLVVNVNLRIDIANLYMYMNNWVWVFVDYNFKPKSDYHPLSFKLNPESDVFKIDTYTEPHDILMLGTELALYSVAEHFVLEDVKSYVPEAVADVIVLVAEGFRIVNVRTGEEVAAVSGFDFFLDEDRLIEYIVHEKYAVFIRTHDYRLFDINHFNSIVEVPGEHWHESLKGQRTFLVNHREIDTTDLIIWNFEDNEDPEYLWRLPGLYAPAPIRENWAHHWDIVNDPLYYMSHAHDINIENVESQNFVALDNGHLHKVDNGSGGMCSMTRVVEYKVTYNPNVKNDTINEKHRIELVFSFPPVEKYEEESRGLEDAPKSNNTLDWKKDCAEFWNYEESGFWFSVHMGSARKHKNGNYVFTKMGADHYPYQLDLECNDHGSVMEIDGAGNVIRYYQAAVRGGITYRLTTFEKEDFTPNNKNTDLKSSFQRSKIT